MGSNTRSRPHRKLSLLLLHHLVAGKVLYRLDENGSGHFDRNTAAIRHTCRHHDRLAGYVAAAVQHHVALDGAIIEAGDTQAVLYMALEGGQKGGLQSQIHRIHYDEHLVVFVDEPAGFAQRCLAVVLNPAVAAQKGGRQPIGQAQFEGKTVNARRQHRQRTLIHVAQQLHAKVNVALFVVDTFLSCRL